MKHNTIKKISQEEISRNQVEGNLPDKPSQAPLYGGRTLTPEEIKGFFDKLPKLIAERYNELVSAVHNGEFDGKSAYQYAVEYGYEGSEEEFGFILAELKTYKEYTDQHLFDHDEAIAELQGDNEQLYMIADELVAADETTAKRVDFCEKRITNLEKGLPADRYVTDESVAYIKRIPTNACPFAAVEKVGGMTYRDGDTLMPTKVTAIEIAGANLFDPATLIEGGATEDNGEYYFHSNTVYNYWQGKSVIPIEYLKPNTQYIIGLEGYNENETSRADSFGFNVSYTDGSGNSEIFTSTQGWTYQQIITKSGKTVSSVRFTYKNGGYNHLRKVFIAEYTGKNTYTPYKTNTFDIPTEVQSLDGYGDGAGTASNGIVWGNGEVWYEKKVHTIDLGALNWEVQSTNRFVAYLPTDKIAKPTGSYKIAANAVCSKYDNLPQDTLYANKVGIAIQATAGTTVYVYDTTYSDATTFKSAMNGVSLCYEMQTPERFEIDDLITADNLIEVEGGGTLTFVNEYGAAAASDILYQVKEAS